MALRFLDSFDHLATADLTAKGYTLTGAPTIGSGNGRNSTNALTATTDEIGVFKSVTVSGSTAIVGFAYQVTAGSNGDDNMLCGIHTGVISQVQFRTNTGTSTISAFRGGALSGSSNTGTLLGTTSAALTLGSFQYLEFKVLIHGSTGTVEVRKNGVAILTLTGVNTANSGTAWDTIGLHASTAGSVATRTWRIDDLYISDGSGASNTDFLGDIRVEALLPSTGNGTNTGLTPSTGSDHGALVDESTPNTTDYNGSATVGVKDTYNYPALASASGTVRGVQYCLYGANSDAGARTICPVVRHSGADYDETTTSFGTSYGYARVVSEANPGAGPGAWTIADINAAEFGMKIVS